MWDELANLLPAPVCTCDSRQILLDHDAHTKLVQFLVGLNSAYDNEKNQILMVDPLPSINKAYGMVLKVEQQREMSVFTARHMETAAMMSKSSGASNKRRDSKKKDQTCTHCRRVGHSRDQCFQLIGFPEWWKSPRGDEQRT